jgi:O-antigen ligase
MTVASIFPIAGLGSCVLLTYGMSSHARELDLMLSLRILDAAVAVAFAGWLVARLGRPGFAPFRGALVRTALAMFAWVAVCLVVARMHGAPWGPFPRHDPSGFAQAAALFIVAADVVTTRRDAVILAAAIVATTLGRAAVQGIEGLYLESYAATLLVLGAPVAMLGAFAATRRPVAWTFVATVPVLLGLLLVTRNRAAAVAAFAVLAMLAWQMRRSFGRRTLGAVAVVFLVGAMVVPSSYVDRFRALWNPASTHATAGLDVSTASDRLELWKAGLDMVAQQPVFGVGPGNYPLFLPIYRTGADPLAAHSNYVQMAAETGVPGVVLYLALFVGTLVALGRIARNAGADWPRRAASMLQLALVAYLAGGIFNSRHDFVLAYLLAGWVVALQRSAVSNASTTAAT